MPIDMQRHLLKIGEGRGELKAQVVNQSNAKNRF